jgi:signal transduction histidine kinase
VELAPDQDQIQVGFVGLDFSAGERLRYQYRLEGGGSEAWSPPAGDRSVNFAHLAPGRYRFSVRAIDSDGQGSEKPATVSFVVLPPIWQRGWFLAVVAAAALALVTAIHRLRVRRLLEIERVRTRIASDLHDDMGASLSRIALQSELARRPEVLDPAGSERILADIGESARTLVDSMSDIVWSIDPRRDDLASLTSRLRQFALGILEPLGASFQMEVPEGAARVRLTPEQRRHLYLILKEAINNIAKHAACRRAFLTLRMERGHLLAEVTDDGRGFEDATGAPVTVASQGGHGLQSIRARAEQIGGMLAVSSAPGKGTTLSVRCPIEWKGA